MNVSRLGDICTGHNAESISGASTVFVNGIPVNRVFDMWREHEHQDPILLTGSATVFAEGLGIGRVGDSISCGSTVATGSNNVFCGG
jgi:uncharacterized Zn-binding protein involved in type VI secretion